MGKTSWTVKSAAAEAGQEEKLEEREGSPAGKLLRYFADRDDVHAKTLAPAMRGLVSLYLETAAHKSANVALVWPGRLEAVTLIHALACFARWEAGYKRGVRALHYPGKRNSFYPLNHVFVSRSRLVKLANQIVECGGHDHNETVKESFPAKDAFLFTVNSVKDGLREDAIRPTVNELLPHFYQEVGDQPWPDYSPRFYSRIRSKLPGRKHSNALKNDVFPEMGAPETAPDAIFSLGYQLSEDDIVDTLRKLKRNGPPPEVVLIDASWKTTRPIRHWREYVVTILRLVREIFCSACPGILVLTDEPRNMTRLLAALRHEFPDAPPERWFKPQGFVHPRLDSGLAREDEPVEVRVPECNLRVHITDFEAEELIEDFYHCVRRLEEGGADATPVRNALAFIARASRLPGSLHALMVELHRSGKSVGVITANDWSHFKAGLIQFINDGQAQGEQTKLKGLLSKTDRLVETYRKATPLGHALESELLDAATNGRKSVVAVNGALHQAALERFLARPRSERETTLADITVLTTDVPLETREIDADRIVHTDASAEVIRSLVCGYPPCKEVVLLLTAPVARQLKFTLAPLMSMPAFGVFHDRVGEILGAIEEQFAVAGRSLLEDMDLWQPRFRISSFEEDDPELKGQPSVLVELEDDHLLLRGANALVYVYDPERASDGHSGFRAIPITELTSGQQIFVMSADLRALIEATLQEKGIGFGHLTDYEASLRNYHKTVIERFNRYFDPTHGATPQKRLLLEKIQSIDSEVTTEVTNLSYWVKLDHSPDTPFEDLVPQAPRDYRVFRAFSKALEFSEPEIQMYWDFLIRPLRTARRMGGRWLSDIYSRILFEPDSVIAHTDLTRDTVDALRCKAMENVLTVCSVHLPAATSEDNHG
ncbi:hypothetical protein [Pseudomonas aeruginosa]|uniref:hypothetical protein n=1 Tax=Pseudomonas aeruginosa TaxID=287 RepID=UPI0005BB7832|nr:hypothetical protein [Pseudomonas aeruginosa]MBG4296335.1 hypothetical protein [Pseudomonas aeruginosa]MBH9455853.1 hypothetical protein [Pseudomonas aeruginosa]MBH9464047.1 hypothetical protein [Pseudomonas aeruginosa]MBN0170567.1 hypothetical protein [Pseudomonas aeruginosa]MCO3738295.1 hypothetical protein [Pseudomonas aeruginosa]